MAPKTKILTPFLLACLATTMVQASSSEQSEGEATEAKTTDRIVVATKSKNPQASKEAKGDEGEDCE